MKVFSLIISLSTVSSLAQDIDLKSRTGTFTNLQGRRFVAVTLVKADLDGLIWRDGAGAGRVCFTNLHPDVLAEFGVPSNRISIARARAENRAAANAQARAAVTVQAQSDAAARAEAAAAEAEDAAAKAFIQQKKAEADFIAALESQIAAAKAALRRAKAQAHDYNAANRHNDFAAYMYVKETERVKIEEAEERVKKLKEEFFHKYGTAL